MSGKLYQMDEVDWLPDQAVNSCRRCHREFSVVLRRVRRCVAASLRCLGVRTHAQSSW
jgi:hypothetical protein